MLDGMLTTALQIIIVLDICGAVFYFLMSGTTKDKEARASESSPGFLTWAKKSPTPQFALSSQLQPGMAAVGPNEPPPIPEWVSQENRSASGIYGLEGATDVAPSPGGLVRGVSRFFSTIKGKFHRQNAHEFSASADLNSDRVRLNKVLESFREEI